MTRNRRRAALAIGAVLVAALAACSSFSSDPVVAIEDAGFDAGSDTFTAPAGDSGPLDAGPEPISIISPYRDGGLVYPEKIVWTLSAVDNAVIHYTTDGTDPNETSRFASGSVILQDLPNETVIKWTVGAFPQVHSFVVQIDGPNAASSKSDGLIFQNFRFANGGVIMTVPKGVSSVNVNTSMRLWSKAECPNCIDVVTVGIDKPVDCLAGGTPGVYPGQTVNGTFKISVPPDPGVYPLRIASSEVFNCQQALQAPLSDVQIGLLIVTP